MNFYEDIKQIRKINSAIYDENFFLERGYDYLQIPPLLKEVSCPVYSPLKLIQSNYDSILDIGCGAGLDIYLISKNHENCRIYGIDISFLLLKEGLNTHKLQVLQSSALSLPFKKNSFQLVILNGVFNQFENKKSLLKEIVHILKPHGHIIVSDVFLKEKITTPPIESLEFNILFAMNMKDIYKLFDSHNFYPKKAIIDEKYTKEFGIFSILFEKRT